LNFLQIVTVMCFVLTPSHAGSESMDLNVRFVDTTTAIGLDISNEEDLLDISADSLQWEPSWEEEYTPLEKPTSETVEQNPQPKPTLEPTSESVEQNPPAKLGSHDNDAPSERSEANEVTYARDSQDSSALNSGRSDNTQDEQVSPELNSELLKAHDGSPSAETSEIEKSPETSHPAAPVCEESSKEIYKSLPAADSSVVEEPSASSDSTPIHDLVLKDEESDGLPSADSSVVEEASVSSELPLSDLNFDREAYTKVFNQTMPSLPSRAKNCDSVLTAVNHTEEPQTKLTNKRQQATERIVQEYLLRSKSANKRLMGRLDRDAILDQTALGPSGTQRNLKEPFHSSKW